MTTRDSHDPKREQYISHKLYLQRRTANRYYNLGYMMYKSIIDDTTNNTATAANLQEAVKNFDIALLFNQNDVDAKARKNELCDKYGVNGSINQNLTQSIIDTARNEAKKIHQNIETSNGNQYTAKLSG